MPLLDNTFVCSNGHRFNANAKIRARCPECGLLTKRSFTEPKTDDKPVAPKPAAKSSIKHTVMLRQGTPRMARPKSKPVVSAKPKVEPKPEPVKAEPKVMPKKTVSKPKATISKTKPVAGGLVKTQRIHGTAIPTIKRKPAKTAVARHIEGRSSRKTSYTDSMIGRFGFGR